VSEANLILRARLGDGAAWTELVREHQQAVFRLAYLLLGDSDEADDVAQETFIRAFRSLDRFDVERPPRPWLLRIASNLALNRRRAAGRYLSALQRLLWAGPEPAGVRMPEESLPAGEADTLWRALRRLSATDQQVIYLRYFLELSVAETAEAMETAPGTVKSRLNRALNRLREVIEREFPGLWKERIA